MRIVREKERNLKRGIKILMKHNKKRRRRRRWVDDREKEKNIFSIRERES